MSAPSIAGAAHGGSGLVEAIGHDAEVDHLAAFAPRQRHGGVSHSNRRSRRSPASSRASPVRRRSPAPRLWAAVHRHGRIVHGGREREVAVAEAAALAAAAPRPARSRAPRRGRACLWRRAVVDDDGVALALGVLLDHDGVGARRDDAAGEDARGFARADRAVERMSGRDLADELEPRPACWRHRARARRSRPSPRHPPAAACAVPRGRRRARGRARRASGAAHGGQRLAHPRVRGRAPLRPASAPRPTPPLDSARTCRRASRSGGCPRCACRARPPSPCRRW